MERFAPFDWSGTTLPDGMRKRLEQMDKDSFKAADIFESAPIINYSDLSSSLYTTCGIPLNACRYSDSSICLWISDMIVSGDSQYVRNGNMLTMVCTFTIYEYDKSNYTSSETTQWRVQVPSLFASPDVSGTAIVYDDSNEANANVSVLDVVCVDPADTTGRPDQVEEGYGCLHIFVRGSSGGKAVKMSNSVYGNKAPAKIIVHLNGLC